MEHFCEIILNLDYCFRRLVVSKISYLELSRLSCLAVYDHLCKFGRGHYGEHSYEILLKLDLWFRSRCCLKKKFTVHRRTMEAE